MKYQHKQDFIVSSAEANFKQELRLSSLSNFLIQISSQHADTIGWGFDDLIKHNLSWVLNSLHIKLERYPKWREKIYIETWPKGINRLFYLRDFLIYDSNNEIIGRASTSWMIIDIVRRRPKMHNLESEVFNQENYKNAIAELIPKLEFSGEYQILKEREFEVNYSDVDINQHLTATRYIDWVFDTLGLSELDSKNPTSFIVNYNKEVIYGRKVIMQASLIDQKSYRLQLVNQDKSKSYFQAELVF